MFTIRHSIVIHAPLERCFALSTSVAVVERELHMRPVAGRTSGLVQAGDTVRWEGTQLGFWNFHESEIRCFEPPFFFQDRMIAGRFQRFEHDHRLTATAEGTRLDDEIRFSLPLGPLGWIVGRLVLCPHITRLLQRRFRLLQHLAESDAWRVYVAG
jgi:ligand-binding SRPBCC domain-containing protein